LNRDQKAAVVEQVAAELESAEAVFAVDYRGLSVTQAAELRGRLRDADASLRIVKNTLTVRAADQAGAESLKELLEGPTALTFVRGDVALAAKAISTFRRENEIPQFKGGTMGGEAVSVEQIESIARLPARDVLQGQFVGVLASPITGLVRGLGSLLGGLAVQLGAIRDQGLVGGAEPETEAPETETESEAEAPAAEAEAPTEDASEETPSEAPGDPVAEAEAADAPDSDSDSETETETAEAPSEGEEQEG
jgi:large subunit ribosomal protein L10